LQAHNVTMFESALFILQADSCIEIELKTL